MTQRLDAPIASEIPQGAWTLPTAPFVPTMRDMAYQLPIEYRGATVTISFYPSAEPGELPEFEAAHIGNEEVTAWLDAKQRDDVVGRVHCAMLRGAIAS